MFPPSLKTTSGPWRPVDVAPEDVEIDIFWVNPDLRDEPVSGVLKFCTKGNGHYFSVLGNAGVPEHYALLWRESRASISAD